MESSIGSDLLEVLEELGSTITIYKYGTGTTYQEYVDTTYEVNQVNPWTSHNMLKVDLAYNTKAEPGDLLTFIDDMNEPTKYLLVALAKERFEREIIAKEGVVYMCNKIVQILELSGEVDSNYESTQHWNNLYSGEYAFVTGNIASNKEITQDFGEFSIDSNLMYLSNSISVLQDHRCIVKEIGASTGDNYRVTVVERNHLQGVVICKLVEDERE